MPVNEEEKRRIIDLHFNQGKTIREVCRIMGKSSHDITPVTKEHRIRLAQNYALDNGKRSDIVQREELNLPGPQVQQFYSEYWNLRKMHKLVTIYQEMQDSIGYFLKLFRLGKKKGLTPEQIMKLVQMADIIHKLQDRLQQLQSEVLDISIRKSVGKDQLKDLHNGIEAAQEKLNSVNKAFKVKYEELTGVYSQAKKLQNYVEQFKDSQDYQELESIVRIEVGKTVSDNRKLLQNALFSVLLSLRNDPDRYFIVDKVELTSFTTTTTIINYNSFQESRRPPYLQGSKQFISGRVLEMAEKILYNLQKSIADSTISTAAGLEEGSSYPVAYRALPYYESPSHLPDQGELK